MSRARSRMQVIKQRVEAFCLVALIVALTVLALVASVQSARSDNGSNAPATITLTTEEKQAPRVADFNDGWRDAKVDDCEQGFKPACDWLRSAK